MLQPMAPKDLIVALTRTLSLWRLPDDWNEIGPFYVEALADCPADLVACALKHARLTLKWFPKPCELREPIVAELSRRREVLTRLRTMEYMAERQAKQEEGGFKYRPPPEEIAAVERMNQRTKARWAATVKAAEEAEQIEPFADLRTAYEKLGQVRPVKRKPRVSERNSEKFPIYSENHHAPEKIGDGISAQPQEAPDADAR